MDRSSAATRGPDPDAVEFVRFCYRRRRVGWPELYDEMCAVAGRGLFRGYGTDDLAALGIGFSLFHMPALAVLASRIVSEEQALRHSVRVTVAETASTASAPVEGGPEATPQSPRPSLAHPVAERDRDAQERTADMPVRLTLAASGA